MSSKITFYLALLNHKYKIWGLTKIPTTGTRLSTTKIAASGTQLDGIDSTACFSTINTYLASKITHKLMHILQIFWRLHNTKNHNIHACYLNMWSFGFGNDGCYILHIINSSLLDGIIKWKLLMHQCRLTTWHTKELSDRILYLISESFTILMT